MLVCILAVTWGRGVSLGGEPIQITKSPDKVDLPRDPSKEVSLPQGLLNSKITGGESSQGPVLPAPGQPLMLRNLKLEELFNRKKNWMMESPNSLDRDQTIEQIFGIQKYELNNGDQAPKGNIERIYEASKDERGTSKDLRGTKDRSVRDGASNRKNGLEPGGGPGSGDDSQNADSRGIIPELNPAYLFNWTPPTDGLSQMNGVLGRSSFLPKPMEDPIFGQKTPGQAGREMQQGPRDIERLWNAQKAPLGRFNDPINTQADVTRAILNPITAMKSSAPPPESSQSRIGAEAPATFGSIVPPVASRPDPFSFGRDRAGIGAGFTTPSAPAGAAPMMQPRPIVLEIPRPKF